MKIEIKDYGSIGYPKKLELKLVKTTIDDVKNNIHDNEEILFEGPSENLTQELSDLHYCKIELGRPTVYYVI